MTEHYLHEGHLALGTFPDSGDQQGNKSLPVHPDGLDGSQPCPPSTPDPHTDTEQFTAAVANLLHAAELVNETARGVLTTLPWQDAVGILHTIRTLIKEHVGPIDASLTRHIYVTAPHGDVEMEGVGVVSVTRSNDRTAWDHTTWQHDARGALIDQLAGGNAEVYTLDGDAINLMDLLAACQDVHGSQAPKVTRLRALKLDDKAYCESVPGKPVVAFK